MKPAFQLIFLFTTLLFISCEKVVDVKLNATKKKYVIEGVVTDLPNCTQVKISNTKDYDAGNGFDGVSGAVVTIEEEGGATSQLIEDGKGIYKSTLQGTPGKKYKLFVTIEGNTFTAASIMQQPVTVDSLFTESVNMGSGNKKFVTALYKDPVEAQNFYRFVQYVNGKKEKTIFTRNDDLSNGRLTTALLMVHDGEVKTNDTVIVQLHAIDANVYRYWYSLSRGATGNSEITPANPVTNIVGGALGYFSAHTVRSKTMVVQ
jgi:hypothetical protein